MDPEVSTTRAENKGEEGKGLLRPTFDPPTLRRTNGKALEREWRESRGVVWGVHATSQPSTMQLLVSSASSTSCCSADQGEQGLSHCLTKERKDLVTVLPSSSLLLLFPCCR
ncbi:hypothetical protein E2C01_063723 [Portunus trituberculatus]|uniref:Uncharacterized protein n=1 Tax=Portunus trituberculatus TaxID=210409 RepID=A0A5B7HJT2_PORTR|nr:hypothetical protein [Portunus trituberculatus]